LDLATIFFGFLKFFRHISHIVARMGKYHDIFDILSK